ncbi:MAG TPA: GTPase Era [bacterium]|nr:GTPase Era [bacterium]
MFHSGYIAIVGVPNVGKSTLLNALLGEKLSIVTDKPQTTRHRILGILNRPKAQLLFLDTPGIHSSAKLLNETIVDTALQAMGDADVVLHLVNPKPELNEADQKIAARAKDLGKPHLVVINKVDRVAKEALLPLIQKIQEEWSPQEIIPVSALQRDGLEIVVKAIVARLPEGPAYYPTDIYTEHDLRFLSAEIVREKAMDLLHQELPYSLATQTEAFDESGKIPHINVALIVEKDSQKGIVIGAKGAMIKRIGELARPDIEAMVGKKVFLELFVKVVDDWTKSQHRLRELGILS